MGSLYSTLGTENPYANQPISQSLVPPEFNFPSPVEGSLETVAGSLKAFTIAADTHELWDGLMKGSIKEIMMSSISLLEEALDSHLENKESDKETLEAIAKAEEQESLLQQTAEANDAFEENEDNYHLTPMA